MFRPAGGRVGGASDIAVAVHQSYPPNTTPARDFVVGVVDTGFACHGGGPHAWLANHIERTEGDVEDIPPNGMLGETHGHGTFIAGLVLREAPAATVRMVKPASWADGDVSAAIRSLSRCRLINLSFAGTEIEQGRPADIAAALRDLPGETVVVMAAGNQGGSDVVYPAGVRTGDRDCMTIAVGAVDETHAAAGGVPPALAPFSNRGPWVDCTASGVQVLGPHVHHNETQDPAVAHLAQHFHGWALWSGTSFAAATVTGVIARAVMEQGLSLRAAAEKYVLGAQRIPVPGGGTGVEWKPYVRGRASTWGEITLAPPTD
ncbi:S8 family peptidase [Actinophytocola sp. KF-1]